MPINKDEYDSFDAYVDALEDTVTKLEAELKKSNKCLRDLCDDWFKDTVIPDFLRRHPEHRETIERLENDD